jgi:hypothetical protein
MVQQLLIIKGLGMCMYPLDATLMGWTRYTVQRQKMARNTMTNSVRPIVLTIPIDSI